MRVAIKATTGMLDVRPRLLDGIFAVVEGRVERPRVGARDRRAGGERIDELHSSGFSNLAYLDVEQRRLHEAAAVLNVSLPLTVEFDLPVCHVWQLGARGRLGLLQGDWQAAEEDAAAVLDRRSAPLARTWAHLVRGLVGLRRTGDAGADLDDAWDLATRLGEPLRLMPAAAALAERAWLRGVPDARLDEAARLLRGSTASASSGRAAISRCGCSDSTPRWSPTTSTCRRRTGCSCPAARRGREGVGAAGHAVYDQALALVETGARRVPAGTRPARPARGRRRRGKAPPGPARPRSDQRPRPSAGRDLDQRGRPDGAPSRGACA